MADTILVPKDTPDWQSLLSNVQASVSDAENYALSTSSFTDRDGNTFQKGAKGWALDAEGYKNTAQTAKQDAEVARDEVLARYTPRGSSDLYHFVDDSGQLVLRIDENGQIHPVGLSKGGSTIQDRINHLEQRSSSIIWGVSDDSLNLEAYIDNDGQLYVTGLSEPVQRKLGYRPDIYQSEFVWGGQPASRPKLSGNWRFWSWQAGVIKIYDGDGTDFPTKVKEITSLSPTGTQRDESVAYDVQKDRWIMCYALSLGKESWIVATGSDGLNWSNQKRVYPETVNPNLTVDEVWAPEWFVDNDGSLHIIVTLNGYSGGEQHIFYPTDSTLTNWEHKGQFFGSAIPSGIIDTQVVYRDGAYYAVWKDEGTGNLGVGISYDGLLGPYDIGSTPITGLPASDKEGQHLVEVEEGRWRLYYDKFTSSDQIAYVETKDWINWTTETNVTTSEGQRHGTVIPGVPF